MGSPGITGGAQLTPPVFQVLAEVPGLQVGGEGLEHPWAATLATWPL